MIINHLRTLWRTFMVEETKYKIMNGFIVFPWSDEREELGEYILRCDREVADKITHLSSIVNAEHTQAWNKIKLTRFSFLNVPRMRNFLLLEKKIVYLHKVLERIWREHEEFEDEIMRR